MAFAAADAGSLLRVRRKALLGKLIDRFTAYSVGLRLLVRDARIRNFLPFVAIHRANAPPFHRRTQKQYFHHNYAVNTLNDSEPIHSNKRQKVRLNRIFFHYYLTAERAGSASNLSPELSDGERCFRSTRIETQRVGAHFVDDNFESRAGNENGNQLNSTVTTARRELR